MNNPTGLQGWLDQISEEIIDHHIEIVDPHHHLWDLRLIKEEPHVRFQQKVYLCEEIAREIAEGGHNVTQTVFAQ